MKRITILGLLGVVQIACAMGDRIEMEQRNAELGMPNEPLRKQYGIPAPEEGLREQQLQAEAYARQQQAAAEAHARQVQARAEAHARKVNAEAEARPRQVQAKALPATAQIAPKVVRRYEKPKLENGFQVYRNLLIEEIAETERMRVEINKQLGLRTKVGFKSSGSDEIEQIAKQQQKLFDRLERKKRALDAIIDPENSKLFGGDKVLSAVESSEVPGLLDAVVNVFEYVNIKPVGYESDQQKEERLMFIKTIFAQGARLVDLQNQAREALEQNNVIRMQEVQDEMTDWYALIMKRKPTLVKLAQRSLTMIKGNKDFSLLDAFDNFIRDSLNSTFVQFKEKTSSLQNSGKPQRTFTQKLVYKWKRFWNTIGLPKPRKNGLLPHNFEKGAGSRSN